MSKEYAEVLEIVSRGEKSKSKFQWDLGDALVRAIGAPNSAAALRGKIGECSQELARHGFDYNPDTLSRFRLIASAFPPRRRHADLPYSTHADAGTPEVLDAILAAAPKGVVIGKTYIREALKARAVAAQRALDREKERRHKARVEAAAAKDAAQRALKKTTDAKERGRLETIMEMADKVIRDNSAPPTLRDIDINQPSPDETPAFLAAQRFFRDAANITYLIGKLEEDYGDLKEFTKTEREAAIENLDAASEALRAFVNRLRKKDRGRAHISIVA